MVPVQVPIIDYQNPFYCPDPLQFHSVKVSDSDDDLSTSSFSAATLAYNHKDVKNRNFDGTGASNPSIHAAAYGRNRITDDLYERPVVGRKLARISYDSSPCARFSTSLDGRAPARKRAKYTGSARELSAFGISDGERKEPCGIKQEFPSPVLPAFQDQDERIHRVSKEGYGKIPADMRVLASTREGSIEDGVTTRTLLLRLEAIFPRVGFREAADSVQHGWSEISAQYRSDRHQVLVDMLGEKGALNEYTLIALHDAEFRHLDLGPVMRGVNELDLPRGDVMRAFSQPGFKYLRTLSFAGGRLRDDFALAHIQPLRQLEKLVLAYTGIGNEGVFHIVALKHKLRHLDLTGNLSINDDAIPALILLENLEYLSLFGTGVLMPGLRKLAVALKGGERVVDVKIPSDCRDYMDEMHKQYLLHPAPPLISDAGIVSMLTKTALSRNLAAHAAINSSIISTGPRNSMEESLGRILEVRNLDLVVREMLVGQNGAK